jgi:prepilin-type N-terminal cleavage/methylation domain-containing protein
MRIRKQLEAESGFTLVEVLIAMTIMSIGLMSIAMAQLTAIKVSSRSKHLQDAMFLAREQMDTLNAIQPTESGVPSFFDLPQVIDDPNIQVGTDQEDGTRFTRRTQIIPNNPNAELARVIVTVTWNNANSLGGLQQITLNSVMRMH